MNREEANAENMQINNLNSPGIPKIPLNNQFIEVADKSAKVAIVRRDCVLLAVGSTAIENNKTCKSKSQVLQVGKNIPVGFMCHGFPELMGVSVTKLMALFRKSLDGNQLPHLEDYPAAFVDFLEKNTKTLFSETKQSSKLSRDVESFTYDRLFEIARGIEYHDAVCKIKTGKHLTKECKTDLVAGILGARIQETNLKKPCWNNATLENKCLVKEIIIDIWKSIFTFCFHEHGNKIVNFELYRNETTVNILTKLFVEEYLKNDHRLLCNRLIFAGFGKDDHCPSVSCLEIDGVLNDQIKYRYNGAKSHSAIHEAMDKGSDNMILPSSTSKILTFAQQIDMSELMLEGMAESFRKCVSESLRNALLVNNIDSEKYMEIVSSFDKDTARLPISFVFDEMAGNIEQLSIEELQHFSEVIINLTKSSQDIARGNTYLKKNVDVAVITKDGGFERKKSKPRLFNTCG